jgi:hypothetical protein
MKSKAARPETKQAPKGQFPNITPEEFKKGMDEYWAKFRRLSKAKQRARLIEMGALTPEGKVPVYPMDHVPLGPRH